MFETSWTGGGPNVIFAYNDPPSIRSVALAVGVANIADITDATIYDTSSCVRPPHVGEIVVWQNVAGYYLATKIEKVQHRGYGSLADQITFSYAIAPIKSVSFAAVR